MYEFLRDLFMALFPTQESGEARHIFRWRQTVAISVLLMGATMSFHIAWACGLLVGFGLSGFATAAEVQSVRQQGVDIRAGQIDREILDAKRAQCLALILTAVPSSEDARLYNIQRLNSQLTLYRQVTGKDYVRVPDCSELVVVTAAVPTSPVPIPPR